jgi:hypothetical protein
MIGMIVDLSESSNTLHDDDYLMQKKEAGFDSSDVFDERKLAARCENGEHHHLELSPHPSRLL